MSETTPIAEEGTGIRDILERMDGGQPTNLLQDDAPEPQEGHEAPTPREDAEAVADQLRRSADEATARARASEHRETQERQARQRSEAELQRTRQSAYESEFNQVSGLLTEREEERERLKGDIRKAADDGDHARMADINYRLGELGAEVRDLRIAKQQFENERSNALRQPAPVQPTAPAGEVTTVGMSRDQFLNGDASRNWSPRSDATKNWLRQHDEFFTDNKVKNMVLGAHSIAEGRGMKIDSPEYFRFLEEQAGMSGTRSPPRGSTSPPAAPPSRDAPGPSGRSRNGDIYVSPQARRVSDWMLKPFEKLGHGATADDAKNYTAEQAELNRRGDLPLRRR